MPNSRRRGRWQRISLTRCIEERMALIPCSEPFYSAEFENVCSRRSTFRLLTECYRNTRISGNGNVGELDWARVHAKALGCFWRCGARRAINHWTFERMRIKEEKLSGSGNATLNTSM